MNDSGGLEAHLRHAVMSSGEAMARCRHRHCRSLNSTRSRYPIAADRVGGVGSARWTIAVAAAAWSDTGIVVTFPARGLLLT
jgi:hypothetical protein